jgi:heme exporter protein A
MVSALLGHNPRRVPARVTCSFKQAWADVAKLVDAADLKSAFRKGVWVRVPPSAPNLRLEVHKLHLWRGDRHLLRGLSFALDPGSALQLLWPNGTGKTSLLRCLAGFLHAEEGQIRWGGVSVRADRDAFHWDMAYLGHDTALKADLTALENLRFACALRVPRGEAPLQAALDSVGLSKIDPRQPVRSLSAGQQRRVALARLSLWDAKLWLLDEPASNLDAAGQAVLEALLKAHMESGGAAILATHHALALPQAHCRLWQSPSDPA